MLFILQIYNRYLVNYCSILDLAETEQLQNTNHLSTKDYIYLSREFSKLNLFIINKYSSVIFYLTNDLQYLFKLKSAYYFNSKHFRNLAIYVISSSSSSASNTYTTTIKPTIWRFNMRIK